MSPSCIEHFPCLAGSRPTMWVSPRGRRPRSEKEKRAPWPAFRFFPEHFWRFGTFNRCWRTIEISPKRSIRKRDSLGTARPLALRQSQSLQGCRENSPRQVVTGWFVVLDLEKLYPGWIAQTGGASVSSRLSERVVQGATPCRPGGRALGFDGGRCCHLSPARVQSSSAYPVSLAGQAEDPGLQ